MIRFAIASLAVLALTTPVRAQDQAAHTAEPDPHAGHAMPAAEAAPGDPASMDHGTMDHGAMDHGTVDHGAVDHGTMDHSAMDHTSGGEAPPSPGPDMETPPPPQAGSGPPRAADAIWGAEAMRASRLDLQQTHGDYNLFWFQADRAEMQVRDGADGYLWDLQGFYGGTTHKFWFKSEGEGSFGEAIEDLEIQALYSRAVAPFFDLQAGVRQDLAGPDTTHAVVGIQGLVPYMFEVDAALFLSHRGDLTARLEAELDQRVTQSILIQPRAELNLSAQDVPQLGIGAGIDSFEVGVRLRYEIIREIAPYIGVEQTWRAGRSADFARARGEDPSVTNFVAGIRLWF
ncbi:copper resistance B family protein [Blastomonas sp. RAC04]|uniref:copper resistance protein B n=1 Tax=Blastomonas sp. RAC04 TaxID=1842535 RepID=UPI00083D67B9|nr:copper resistance protein B [Blastomonas sp. RAC04]AOG01509.1 copper resistance B family protein [Blastomonas sp. RAC04]